MFFKNITLENGFELSENVHYRYFKTSMDYLQKIISKVNLKQAKEFKSIDIPFMDIVKVPTGTNFSNYYRIQRDKIINTIRQAKEDIKKLYLDYQDKQLEDKESVRLQAAERKQDCVEEIDKMSECETTMYFVLKELGNKENRDVYRFIFEVLFGKPNEAFFRMIQNSKEQLYKLEESDDGDINLYGFKYKKVPI